MSKKETDKGKQKENLGESDLGIEKEKKEEQRKINGKGEFLIERTRSQSYLLPSLYFLAKIYRYTYIPEKNS